MKFWKKYASFIKNNQQWVDDYDQYQGDIRLINEARFALWDNNPALLKAEYELGLMNNLEKLFIFNKLNLHSLQSSLI